MDWLFSPFGTSHFLGQKQPGKILLNIWASKVRGNGISEGNQGGFLNPVYVVWNNYCTSAEQHFIVVWIMKLHFFMWTVLVWGQISFCSSWQPICMCWYSCVLYWRFYPFYLQSYIFSCFRITVKPTKMSPLKFSTQDIIMV